MMSSKFDRRKFIRSATAATSAAGLFSVLPNSLMANDSGKIKAEKYDVLNKNIEPKIKFSVIGMNHNHIYGQVDSVIRGGGQLVSFYAKEPDLAAAFSKRYPQSKHATSEKEILDDKSIQLVLSSIVPYERAPLGISVMQAGKDYMSDKPGITSLEQLAEVRRVQKETKRIYSIMYSERFENKATVKAGELVQAGAIGKVIQTIGLGPHRMSLFSRPDWFFDKKYYGGIICDIGSHQFDQFLFFTDSTKGDIEFSQTGNVAHPQYPQFEDFGDVVVRGNGGTGYIRLDWFTPDGLKSWGDGRLTILGTKGFIEVRKNIDIAGPAGGNHLYIVDEKHTRFIDCNDVYLPYGEQLVNDILNRTETAMTQDHCFLATELALKAQAHAKKLELNKA